MNLTWLYVPASRPDRFAKAVGSGADVVILDLEDAVRPTDKVGARANVVAFLADRPSAQLEVRVNAGDTPWGAADLDALDPAVAVRVPKLRTPAGVPAGRPVVGLIEDAVGLEAAAALAATPGVVGLGLGEADLASDLGATGIGLLWARSRLVSACRAAGLPAPAMSVYPRLRDPDGLRRHCRLGRRLGFLGASAIHPEQLPVIEAAFRPTEAEVAAARAVVEAGGAGGVRLADDRFVDPAMLAAAHRTLALATRPRAEWSL